MSSNTPKSCSPLSTQDNDAASSAPPRSRSPDPAGRTAFAEVATSKTDRDRSSPSEGCQESEQEQRAESLAELLAEAEEEEDPTGGGPQEEDAVSGQGGVRQPSASAATAGESTSDAEEDPEPVASTSPASEDQYQREYYHVASSQQFYLHSSSSFQQPPSSAAFLYPNFVGGAGDWLDSKGALHSGQDGPRTSDLSSYDPDGSWALAQSGEELLEEFQRRANATPNDNNQSATIAEPGEREEAREKQKRLLHERVEAEVQRRLQQEITLADKKSRQHQRKTTVKTGRPWIFPCVAGSIGVAAAVVLWQHYGSAATQSPSAATSVSANNFEQMKHIESGTSLRGTTFEGRMQHG